MRKCAMRLAMVVILVALACNVASAQDYRARVQGNVLDESKGVMPGVTVTLINDATGVKNDRVTDEKGHYLFDFVDPGGYTVTAELDGFKKAEQKNVRVAQRGDATVDLTLVVGGITETVTVEAAPVVVQFNSSSSDITLERQLIDQAPISGRNPYSLANLDPTIIAATGTSENRPYHHAYANDYDAGGGTTRANDVLLDGVALGASYKTSYTPAVDAVEEVTVSKNSVDAENGHSLGGVISLNMKSGTNQWKGSAYSFLRDPKFNSLADPTVVLTPGQDTDNLRGTRLRTYGATVGFPIRKNKIFSFSSYEQWDDKRPLTIIRTVPTAAERAGDFSQSVAAGVVRTVYDPYTSVLGSNNVVTRTPFANNIIPTNRLDPVALKMLGDIPLPNLAGYTDNWQGSVYEKVDYWNFSQRLDFNITDNWKIFARLGKFKADLAQQNPTDAGYFPLSGSKRYGMSIAADSVWVMSNRMTLNVRGSFYNMTDDFYNPSLELGQSGLANYWSNNWYSSLYTSGYTYYPALDVYTGTGASSAANRLGRQGREWWQHPKAWTAAVRLNRYQGSHNMKAGAEMRGYFGKAARFEPINWVFNSTLTANSSNSPAVATSGNQWASFMLGALDANSSARLVPLQTPRELGYAVYFQDDWKVNDRLTMNLGLRWEYEPGATDPDNRLSRGLDLTQPIAEMVAAPPTMNATASAMMASKGYGYTYNGAWQFVSSDSRSLWHTSWKNFLPRFGLNYKVDDKSVVRFGYARFMMPVSNLRDTLGAFVDQYAGYSQNTFTLGPSNGVPQQTLNDPFPVGVNPVIQPSGKSLGTYTNLGGTPAFDTYELRPQINDRINVSYQRQLLWGTIFDVAYFLNYGSRVPYSLDINMMDPAFRYESGATIATSVTNPFRGYLTADKFPGALRNSSTVAMSQLLKPYPQYSSITQSNMYKGSSRYEHSLGLTAQRPFTKGFSILVAYAYTYERIKGMFDDVAQWEVLQTDGASGWEWQPTTVPSHRVTSMATWQIPVGRERKYGASMPMAADWFVGGWQYTASFRWYSGTPFSFAKYAVTGNPKLDSPTRSRWFDTTMFATESTYVRRTNPTFYDGMVGPTAWFSDMTLTKSFKIKDRYRLEARAEAYNAFNHIVWGQPNTTLSSSNFGKITTKRGDSTGREFQFGVRFVF
jgi:hypothetical protein